MQKNPVVFDIEVYPNYYLLAFKSVETGKEITFDNIDKKNVILNILKNNLIIGFNILNYDLPILKAILSGYKNEELYSLSKYIIGNSSLGWQTEKEYNLHLAVDIDCIDLSPIVLGYVSLKTYASRLNVKKLQSLPYPFDTELTYQQVDVVRKYCLNDLEMTTLLYKELKPQIETRLTLNKLYGYRDTFNSKSDAQIAEYIIKYNLGIISGKNVLPTPSESFKYIAPNHVVFESERLKEILKIVTSVDFKYINEKLIIPKEIESLIYKSPLTGLDFQLGAGGLHSCENSQNYKSTKENLDCLVDCDVNSYYPNIIINNKYQPSHLPGFLDVYKGLVDKRLKAKRDGDKTTSDMLKIVINSSFGKFGSKYSVLFSNELMIQTTITGQLYLLMLIERLENNEIDVVSANTDGLVSLFSKNKLSNYQQILINWQRDLKLQLEIIFYQSIYIKDVNNYFALDCMGIIKKKGIFVTNTLQKNHLYNVCSKAVIEYLINKVNIRTYIRDCKDINDFVILANSKNGCFYDGKDLGKVVRFYWSNTSTTTVYDGNKDTIPLSDNSSLLMDLPDELPKDIDYKRYENQCYNILESVGVYNDLFNLTL